MAWNKQWLFALLKDVRFWIALFFLVRLLGITNPPLESGHHWRQVTGLMVARNFLEVDPNILYPRVDDHGSSSGIIGMEFPSMNYLYFLSAKIFGYTHWYGRLINLIISSLGLLIFYRLILMGGYKEKLALNATIILAVSIWFSFSRKMMPDTYCISLIFMAWYCGLRYLKDQQWLQLLLFILLSSLAILSKIPAGIYLALFLPILLSHRFKSSAKLHLLLASIPSLLLCYYWYFVWNPQLALESGMWYNAGKSLSVGFMEIISNLGEALHKFYFDTFNGFILFGLFLLGLGFAIAKKERTLLTIFTSIFGVFLLYIFKSGFFFYHHNYYIIPFVPVMALLAAYGISQLKKPWLLYSLLCLGVVESLANQQHDFFIRDSKLYKMELEAIMDKFSSREQLIAINGNEDPQLMYLSHRKGWNCHDEELGNDQYIQKLISERCKFFVLHHYAPLALSPSLQELETVYQDENFLIKRVDGGND